MKLDQQTKELIRDLLTDFEGKLEVIIDGTTYKPTTKGGEVMMNPLNISPASRQGGGRYAKLGVNIEKGDLLTIRTIPYEDEAGKWGPQTMIDASKEDGTQLKVKLTKMSQRNLASSFNDVDLKKGAQLTDKDLETWIGEKVVVGEMPTNFGTKSIILEKA